MTNIGRDNVYNAEESVVNLEIQQTVEGIEHYNTILPAISADERLLSRLFLVLKDLPNMLGPEVAQEIVLLNCSS